VFFYPADSKTPAELVINKISKDHIHGYVSEPKYKGAEVEAKATTSTNIESVNANDSQPATAKPSPARQRLEPPK